MRDTKWDLISPCPTVFQCLCIHLTGSLTPITHNMLMPVMFLLRADTCSLIWHLCVNMNIWAVFQSFATHYQVELHELSISIPNALWPCLGPLSFSIYLAEAEELLNPSYASVLYKETLFFYTSLSGPTSTENKVRLFYSYVGASDNR